jgi:hypothetical protein
VSLPDLCRELPQDTGQPKRRFFVFLGGIMDFRTEHKIKIMYSDGLVGKAPPRWKPADWARYYATFKAAEVTPRTFAGLIWQGYGFTPLWGNGRRKEENFTEAHHVAFDFDAHGAALDVLMAAGSFAWYYASFAYATPSSTQDHPKSRVVFVLLEPVTDAAYYRRLYKAMAWLFAEGGSYTDPACKDPLRLYYGSPKANMVGNWSVVTPPMAEMWIGQYDRAHPPERQGVLPKVRENISPGKGWARRTLAALCDNIAMARDGEKHHTRLKMAYTVGGYVASGVMDEWEATQELIRAALSNTKDPEKATQAILDGIKAGKELPLYPERPMTLAEELA